ncbi:spermidine synthase [Sphingomonas sp. RIT328]|uniref:spermidine synthase n=1 Tax=Sphingomonas sp. RIT328 TaxID=1470591 RepID=UPI00044C9024|nr:fused MFS/spermidine synthase [Sphingomonas sp. RIT328]EZP56733.1 putative membrane protein [Sphingomonas sp. RIT328]
MAERAGDTGRACRITFVATILTGSFLLFLVQPMVARMALPRLGGAPAVWNSAMLVYQTLLLAGYAYAHALARLRPWVQAAVHVGVLLIGAAWLPIGLTLGGGPAGLTPALWVPWLLGASIGPLFFAVSAQAPLVQRWFSIASRDGDPYALYAASNLGSFGGLIAYPLVVEPLLALRQQSWLWSAGYAVLILLVIACAIRLPRGASADVARPSSAPATRRRVLHWIALSLVPSGLMLATSTYITTDIVAMPLLWVLPLGLYLLSFTIAFAANREIADLLTRIAPITILMFGGVMIGGFNESPLINLAIALTLLFMVSVALHTQLYRLRPEPDRLTGFYLAMAVGGALGGVFAGLVAPVVFDWTYEYPILIFAAGLLVPQVFLTHRIRGLWRTPAKRRFAYAGVIALLVLLTTLTFRGPADLFGEGHQGLTFIGIALIGVISVGARTSYALILAVALVIFGGWRAVELSLAHGARTRSYFGVYTVRDGRGVRELDHGTTVHGIQFTGSPVLERLPTTYYAPPSGIGQAMEALDGLFGPTARVGVVGLGTGTLACYAQPAQRWRFYEIDPVVVRIARDTGQFTYLRDCLPHPDIRVGDARISLEADRPASLDLLALDAFSSDAIPMHLMTQEAFADYARVLQPRGLLLVHISNRFLDLEPVVAAAARAGGWQATKLYYQPPQQTPVASPSQWIALSRDAATLRALKAADRRWAPLVGRPGFVAWTDDYSTILPLLKWHG